MYDKIDRVRKGFSDKKLSLLTIWSQIEKEAIPGCDVTVPVRKQSGWCFVHRTLVSSVWVSISADGCRICRGVLSCILKLSPLYPNFTSSFTNSSIAVSRLELFIIIRKINPIYVTLSYIITCIMNREILFITCRSIPDIIVAEQKVCGLYVDQSLAFHFVPQDIRPSVPRRQTRKLRHKK